MKSTQKLYYEQNQCSRSQISILKTANNIKSAMMRAKKLRSARIKTKLVKHIIAVCCSPPLFLFLYLPVKTKNFSYFLISFFRVCISFQFLIMVNQFACERELHSTLYTSSNYKTSIINVKSFCCYICWCFFPSSGTYMLYE